MENSKKTQDNQKAFKRKLDQMLFKHKQLVVNEECIRTAKKDKKLRKTIGWKKIHYDY